MDITLLVSGLITIGILTVTWFCVSKSSDRDKAKMKDWVVALIGLATCISIGWLMALIQILFGMLHSMRGTFFMSPVYGYLVSTRLVECLCGAFVAGYFSKGKSMIMGVIVAYLYITFGWVGSLVSGLFAPFSEIMRWSFQTTVFYRDLENYLFSTVIFLGLVGGKTGELFRRKEQNESSM